MAGSKTARGKGVWQLRVDAPPDPIEVIGRTSTRRQITRTFRGGSRAADRALEALVDEVRSGAHTGTDLVHFGPALERWLMWKVKQGVEATTAANYRYAIGYVPEALRETPMRKITRADLEALYTSLRTRGRKRDGAPLSVSQVKAVHLVVSQAFDFAQRREWVPVNVALGAKVPGGPPRLPTPAPVAILDRLLEAAGKIHPDLPTYTRLTIASGGRRGEVHGLRWAGVDFARRRITLIDTVVRGDAGWIIKPRTKTGKGRTIDLDSATIDALAALKARRQDALEACGDEVVTGSAFVFSDTIDGSMPANPSTTWLRFKRACRAAGVDVVRLHDLRSTMATELLDRGVPLPVVSARLGHADATTTLRTYTGHIPKSDRSAADVMGEILGGN